MGGGIVVINAIIYFFLLNNFFLEHSKKKKSKFTRSLFFTSWVFPGSKHIVITGKKNYIKKNYFFKKFADVIDKKYSTLLLIRIPILNLQLLSVFKRNRAKKFNYFAKGKFKRRRINAYNMLRHYYYLSGQRRELTFRRKRLQFKLNAEKQLVRKYNFLRRSKSSDVVTGYKRELTEKLGKLGQKKRRNFWKTIWWRYFLGKKAFKQKRFKRWKVYSARSNSLKYWSINNGRGVRIGKKEKFIYRFILNTCFLKSKFPYIGRYNFLSLLYKPRFYLMLKRVQNNYFFTVVDCWGAVKVSISAGNLSITKKKKKRPLYVTKELLELMGRKLYQLGIRKLDCVLLFFFNRRLFYDIFFILKRFRVRIRKYKLVDSRPHGKLPRGKKLRRI